MKKFLCLLVVCLLSGCASVNTNNMTVREKGLGEDFEFTVKVDEVSSESSSLSPEKLRLAVSNSLAGHGILAAEDSQADYSVSANFLKSSAPTWGTKTKVVVTMSYSFRDAESDSEYISETMDVGCVSSVSTADTISGAIAAGFGETGVHRDKTVAVVEGSEQDRALGFPIDGTPISSMDAYTRSLYARECAIRKSISLIILDISNHHEGNT